MKLLIVDAFTNRPFAGNPAAVCLLEQERDAKWMQDVAAEMNLSETAFVRVRGDGFELRWFTPAIEVELCGHATLASAHALWTEGLVKAGHSIRFHTKSGVLTCTQAGDLIELDFAALRRISMPGVIVTSLSENPQFDFISRYFAPGAGIDEDAVTGSAHCCLGPYWSEQLGKSELTGFQASPRGGIVRVRVKGDRVLLGGQAVTFMTGELV